MLEETLEQVVSEEARFSAGGASLYRRSARPAGPAWARLGVLHGYGEHSGRFVHFLEWMAERGVACHALDFRGQGRSSGRRGHVSPWTQYLADLEAFLAEPPLQREEDGPLFLLGHSHGGLILTSALLQGLSPTPRGLVLTAPFLRRRLAVPPVKIFLGRLLNPVLPWLPLHSGLKAEWMSRDREMVEQSRRDPLIVHVATPRWYFGMVEAQETVFRRAPELRVPLLVLIGDEDPVADPRAAEEFFQRVGAKDKSCIHYPAFLHEILREMERERVFEDILAWIRQRVPREER